MTEQRYRSLAEQQRLHHRDSFRKRLSDGSIETWIDADNADYWGSNLVLEGLRSPFRQLTRRKILTIGDGKGGKEAIFLKELGHDVTATDICPEVLSEVYRRALIDKYTQADVENLQFADDEFDIVMAKETLHHLSRPYVGLYEMIRVAREGIVIAEPHYRHSTPGELTAMQLLSLLTQRIRRLTPQPKHHMPDSEYEPSGNFVFRFSPFDLARVCRAAGLSTLAIGYGHMFYETGCHLITGIRLKRLIAQKRREMRTSDLRNGIESRPMLLAVLWKCEFPKLLSSSLTDEQFSIYDLST